MCANENSCFFLTRAGREEFCARSTARPPSAHCQRACHSQLINFSASARARAYHFFLFICTLLSAVRFNSATGARIAMSFQAAPISVKSRERERARTPRAPRRFSGRTVESLMRHCLSLKWRDDMNGDRIRCYRPALIN